MRKKRKNNFKKEKDGGKNKNKTSKWIEFSGSI